MSTADKTAWQRTSPLSVVFFIGSIVKAIVQNAVQAVAPIAAYAFASDGSAPANAAAAVTVGLIGIVAVAILRFLFFRFCIQDASILIRDGIIKKTQLDIKFERIQAINTQQNILFRPFGLVNVSFDTAGSSEQEGSLPAVPAALAETLKRRLAAHTGKASAAAPDADRDPVTTDTQRQLLSYTAGDLVRVGLTSNRAVILVAALAPFAERLFTAFAERVGGEDVSEAIDAATSTGGVAVVGTAFLFVGVVAALLVLASLTGAVLRYYAFELAADGKRFQSSGGLLTRHEHAIQYAKIQALYLVQNPVQRLFSVFRLSARQAASDRESEKKSFQIPLLEEDVLHDFTREAYADEFDGADLNPARRDYHPVASHYLYSRTMLYAVLPAILAAASLATLSFVLAGFALLWAPVAHLYFRRRYRVLGVRLDRDGLTFRRGLIGYRVVALLYRKVQRVTVRQTPFQRRRGTAGLSLYLASGRVRIPYLPIDDAERLRDYILYKVESDRRAWH